MFLRNICCHQCC